MGKTGAPPSRLYRALWHKPADPSRHPGLGLGDYLISGAIGIGAKQLKAHILSVNWPVATIFEVRLMDQREGMVARCFVDQIKAWRTSRDLLPAALPIEVPVSRHSIIAKFRDLVEDALLYARANDLLDDEAARRVRQLLVEQLPA